MRHLIPIILIWLFFRILPALIMGGLMMIIAIDLFGEAVLAFLAE